MKPQGSDLKKLIKNRLYDSGISYYPMPSVVRRIETNSGNKSFVSNTNVTKNRKAKRGSKIRIQNDMSADYAREGGLPNLKRGAFEESKDYSANNPHNSMLSGAYGSAPYEGPGNRRAGRLNKGGYPSFNESITGIKTSKELRPALQVKQSSMMMGKGSFYGSAALPGKLPPLKRDSLGQKDSGNSPDKSSNINMGSYAYEDLNNASFSAIEMTDEARAKIFSCPEDWKKRKVEITKIRAGEEDEEDAQFEREETIDGKPVAKDISDLEQVQKAVNNKEWVDLDRYIELLLDSKSEDEIVFLY